MTLWGKPIELRFHQRKMADDNGPDAASSAGNKLFLQLFAHDFAIFRGAGLSLREWVRSSDIRKEVEEELLLISV